MQVEYSFDLVWRSAEKLAPVYEELSRQAILTVKAPEVAKFLGKRFSANTDTALGSDFHTRVESTRVKHFLGPASLKLEAQHRARLTNTGRSSNPVARPAVPVSIRWPRWASFPAWIARCGSAGSRWMICWQDAPRPGSWNWMSLHRPLSSNGAKSTYAACVYHGP
jgi:hypothetical protein